MSINLSISFSHPDAIAHQISYARIDNTTTPVFTTVPNISAASGTFRIAENVPDGQYQINALPIYADGRVCSPTTKYTPACPGLNAINAILSGSVLVVSYLAPSNVPKVRITINYPNGGSFVANYVNDGNDISIGLPAGVYGNYTVSGRSICDESSGFYSPSSSSVTVSRNQPVPGNYTIGASIPTVCSGTPATRYTDGVFSVGGVLYTDSTLLTPVTGSTFVLNVGNGHIYQLNATTGIIGPDTGSTCGSGTAIFSNSVADSQMALFGGSAVLFAYTPGLFPVTTVNSPVNATFNSFTAGLQLSITGTFSGSHQLQLVVNSVPIQSISVSAVGTYIFTSRAYSNTDTISISFV